MSILVYGGQGALGRVLVNRLKPNYKVISVDLREFIVTNVQRTVVKGQSAFRILDTVRLVFMIPNRNLYYG